MQSVGPACKPLADLYIFRISRRPRRSKITGHGLQGQLAETLDTQAKPTVSDRASCSKKDKNRSDQEQMSQKSLFVLQCVPCVALLDKVVLAAHPCLASTLRSDSAFLAEKAPSPGAKKTIEHPAATEKTRPVRKNKSSMRHACCQERKNCMSTSQSSTTIV